MKILRIVSSGFEEGGVENGVVLMQPIFERRGHVVRTLSSDLRPDLPHFNNYTYKIPTGAGKILYSFNPYAYFELKRVLKEFNPDVVHVHTIGHGSPSIFFALNKYPTVLTVHGPEPFTKSLVLWCFPENNFKHGKREVSDLTVVGKLRYFYHRYINDPLFAVGFRNVDKVVTLSHYMHDLVKHDGQDNEYIPNGTTLLAFHPLQKGQIENTLVYAGRLESYKGVGYLVEALQKIVSEFPDTHLFIAGDGKEKENLIDMTEKLGVKDNVTFLGHLKRNELEKLYIRSSVMVMPSVYPEAFGKVGVEAMSVGRPVIATDVGGVSDWLVNGEVGYLVPPSNSTAIADAVIKLFSDKEKLVSMSEKARKESLNFGLEKHVDRMIEIYEELLKVNTKK